MRQKQLKTTSESLKKIYIRRNLERLAKDLKQAQENGVDIFAPFNPEKVVTPDNDLTNTEKVVTTDNDLVSEKGRASER